MKNKKESLRGRALVNRPQGKVAKTSEIEEINLARIIRSLRESKGLSGAGVCRTAGDLDPRTLTAVEKGRIKNPSVKTLQSLARGLGVAVADLFRQGEMALEQNFCLGNQKGDYQLDFPKRGLRVVSFTPLIRDFFCGKLIFGPKRKLDSAFLSRATSFYVSVLIGKLEIAIEDKRMLLKEGDNLFFNGILKARIYNPLERDSVALFVTAPSFV